MGNKNTFNIEKSPIKEAYLLLDADRPGKLDSRYTEEDQKLMRADSWDYKNPDLIVNKVRSILEDVNLECVLEQERYWYQNILWFWYHHAMSCALWKHKDKAKALEFSAKALEYQPENHPNKITHLMYLLIQDRLEEAEKWERTITTEPEKNTAKHFLEKYKQGAFGMLH